LIDASVRQVLRLLGWLVVGLFIGWASRLLFYPGWPLMAHADNIWVGLAVILALLLLCGGATLIALRYYTHRRWEFDERTKNLDFPSWTELRRLGQSNAVKLTALAPVIGSLILMNDEVDALLRSTLLDFSLDQSRKPMLGFVHIPRLHMIYLGLSLLGVGAICFGLLCPDVIKRYPSAEDWLGGEDRFLTGGRLRGEFQTLIQTYWDNTYHPPKSPDEAEDEEDRAWPPAGAEDRERKKGYSSDRYYQVHALIDEIVEKEDPSEGHWEPPEEEPSRVLGPDGAPAVRERPYYDDSADRTENFRRFRAGPRGHVNTDAWLYVLAHGAPVERHLWQSLIYTAADSFKERIVHIRFQDLAYQHRVARGVISAIYGLGIIALAIPTLHTFGAIITSALR
jgi:hypothetical protein